MSSKQAQLVEIFNISRGMIEIDMTDLSELLTRELNERGWSMRKLGRRAKVSHSLISEVINGNASPSADFVVSIAHALDADPVRLLRLAGILPDVGPAAEEAEHVAYLLNQMKQPDRDYALRLLMGLAQSAGPLPGSERPTIPVAAHPQPRCPDCPLHDELSREQRLDALRRMLAQFGEDYYPAFLRLVTEQLEEQQREDALLRNGNERPTQRPRPGSDQPGRADHADPTTENHAAASGAVRGNY